MKKADMHHAHPPFELGLGLPAVAESAPGNLGTDDLFAQARGPRVTATEPERTSSITP